MKHCNDKIMIRTEEVVMLQHIRIVKPDDFYNGPDFRAIEVFFTNGDREDFNFGEQSSRRDVINGLRKLANAIEEKEF